MTMTLQKTNKTPPEVMSFLDITRILPLTSTAESADSELADSKRSSWIF